MLFKSTNQLTKPNIRTFLLGKDSPQVFPKHYSVVWTWALRHPRLTYSLYSQGRSDPPASTSVEWELQAHKTMLSLFRAGGQIPDPMPARPALSYTSSLLTEERDLWDSLQKPSRSAKWREGGLGYRTGAFPRTVMAVPQAVNTGWSRGQRAPGGMAPMGKW